MEPGAGASGGLIAPVTELIPLLRCVADGGVYDGTRVLSAELVDEMRRLQSPPLPTADGAERGYGYGWEVSEFLGETLVAHRGAIGVSGGYVGVLPERGVGVAMAYNRLGRGPIRTGKGVLSILAGESPAETVRLVAVDDAVEAVCGRYTSYQDAMTVDVERAPAGTIRVSLPDRGTSFTATPEEVSADACTFAATMGGGVKWLAEFDRGSSDVELILSMGKWTARLSDG
jgi:CubicO group peptidase (beta-lactamase class C family)